MPKPIVILPFQPENQDEVKNLVETGLAEHWGLLDSTKNPDLNDISTTYANDIFLVAWEGNKIVGTGALVHYSEDTGEIVRMSVVKEMRRKGVGRLILQRLIEQARLLGYRRIILETTNTWHEVIEFYLRCGFQITHYRDGDVYFEMNLPDA